MQIKSSNNYESTFLYVFFGALILGLFPLAVALANAHWLLTVVVSVILCYPLTEFIFHSALKIQLTDELICFSKPWRKYSLIKKRPDYFCVLRSDEWDQVIFSHKKDSSTYYFFNAKKAVYSFSCSGIPEFENQLRSVYFPQKIFTQHESWQSINLMPELFTHYPEAIL